jgi:molybdopterin-containing oxidoreductase family iron-sulfur binding subunit
VVASAKPAEAVKVTADAKKVGAAIAAEPKAAAGGIEVAFVQSASSWDGSYANNGWMQEAPDPMTKLTWGNALMISPAMARKQGVRDGDVVELSRAGLKWKRPSWSSRGMRTTRRASRWVTVARTAVAWD